MGVMSDVVAAAPERTSRTSAVGFSPPLHVFVAALPWLVTAAFVAVMLDSALARARLHLPREPIPPPTQSAPSSPSLTIESWEIVPV
jgi:hypothetical protein